MKGLRAAADRRVAALHPLGPLDASSSVDVTFLPIPEWVER
jgi:hypothetical protein